MPVAISGTLTYDFVPHKSNNIGLDYAATEERPIRGARVELVNQSGQVLARTDAGSDGRYRFDDVPANTQVRVRVRAELIRTQTPSWNISVTDNTSGNALYVVQGSLASSGTQDSTRDLHAPSGWGGSSYTSTRVAAYFAILDAVYTGLQRLQAAGLNQNLPAMEFRWSFRNLPANGDLSLGEIGTSFYADRAVYLLGAANNDTDEYDVHIVLHEWTHYLDDVIFRSDSIGGGHTGHDRLDKRVAFSEGMANAMSGIILDDPVYRDTSGFAQGDGFFYNMATSVPGNRGWFSESSVEALVYSYYTGASRSLDDILQALTATSYRQTPALISIYPFVQQLKLSNPGRAGQIDALLSLEQISTTADVYGNGETNSGGAAANLPIYHGLTPGGGSINVCSSPENGKHNKLGVSRFIRFTLAIGGFHTIRIQRSGGASVLTDPDFELFRRGSFVHHGFNDTPNLEQATLNLQAGEYAMVVYDWNNFDPDNTANNITCFDVSIN